LTEKTNTSTQKVLMQAAQLWVTGQLADMPARGLDISRTQVN